MSGTNELARLIAKISESEMELENFLQGQVDAILGSDGKAFLLRGAQQRLLESEQLQRDLSEKQAAILDALPDHIAVIDQDGLIVAVNRAWCRFGQRNGLLGGDAWQGRNYLAQCEPGLADEIRALIAGERAPLSLEYPCHSPTEQRWFRLTANPLVYGTKAGAVLSHTDITLGKLATDRLALATVLAKVGWWIVDLESQRLEWSDQVCAIHELALGTRPNAEDAFDFYAPEWQPVIRRCFEECAVEGTGWDLELELITATGRRIWVRAIGRASRDKEGKVRYIEGAFQDISEKRQLADQLATTLESITDAFYALDSEWRFTYLNHHAERWLKRNRSELLGKVIWDEFPDTMVTTVQAELQKAMREQVPGEFEHYSSGLEIWIHSHLYPSPQGLAVYFRDVTVERKVQAETRLMDERFRALARATSDAIWDVNLVTGDVWWSDGFHHLLGSTDAPSRTTWMERIHPDDVARVEESIKEMLQGRSDAFRREYRVRRADGSDVYVLDRSYVIRGEGGEAQRLIGGVSDITEQHKAQEKLAQQASLLDEAQDAITVSDLGHLITYWNRSAERLYGYTAAEAIGRRAPKLLDFESELFDEACAKLLRTGHWVGEMLKISKDAGELCVESRWTLVRDDKGQPKSILVIDTDVSERRKLEQQFLRAQRLESIGTLAGGIAHDLNNVLAPIMLATELLKMEEKDPENLEVLTTISDSAQRGADMVSQVLSFARGVGGRRESMSLGVIVAEISKVVNDTFLKNVRLRTRVSEDLPQVCGDSTQIHQVLLNLCVNARDAMPKGGELSIVAYPRQLDEAAARLDVDAQARGYVCIEVTDSGTGIPAEVLDKIFEPFYTTKEFGSGTGLGLSTSHSIVKSHGGFIHVESSPGIGTTFKVYLPCDVVVEQMEAVPKVSLLQRGSGETILIVDDEPAVAELNQKILKAFGYRTLMAADGAQALSLYALHRDHVALVLTDMMMPVLDGPATVAALLELNPQLRIVGVSGLKPTESSARGLFGFLQKPYSVEALLTVVGQALL